MATRNVVLSIGSGPDQVTTKGTMLVHRVYPGPNGDGVLIYDTPEPVALATEPTKVELEVGQYFTFTPAKPTGDPITAKIPAGTGDILLSALEPVNPRTLQAAAVAPPAWFLEIQQVQGDLAGISGDVTAAQETAAAAQEAATTAQATADAAAPQSVVDELTEVVDGKADTTALEAETDARTGDVQAINTTLAAKADLVGGKIPSAQIPAIAVTDVFPVASQADMLALTAQRGDVAVRSDNSKTYILSTDNPGTLADWLEVTSIGKVQTVNGQQGAVVLGKTDVGLAAVDNTPDNAKPVSVAQAAADAAATAAAQGTSLQKTSNLLDLTGPAIARENLQLGDYGKMLPWFAALANRRKAPADIVILGDSGVEGYSLSAMADTIPVQLAEALRSRFGVKGVSGGRGFIGVQNDFTNQPFWPDVYTGAVNNVTMFAAGYGPNRRHFVMTSASQKVVRTVPTEGLTGFDIHVLKGPGSPVLYYKINGGTAVTIPTSNAALLAGVINVPTAVPGGGTIEVGWSSGGAVYYCGITEYNGDDTKGVRVHNLGQSGSTVALWRTNDSAAGQWLQALPFFTPKALILMIGGNDIRTAGGNISAATFQTTLPLLISEIRAIAGTGFPIVVSMMYNQSSTNSGMTGPWSGFVAAAKAVAAADPTVIVVDHSVRMPAWNVDGAQLYNAGSSPHATAKGYGLMADTLVPALSPR